MDLSKEAKKWKKQLESEYDLSDSGAQVILQQVLEAFDQLREAQAIVSRDGFTFVDRFSQVKNHPLLTTIRDCRAQILSGVKQLNFDIENVPNPGAGRPPGR